MLFTSWFKKGRSELKQKALVLMYHRIADVSNDPWQISVSPDYFEQQLQVLKKNFTIAPINNLGKQWQQGFIASNTVYLTFDDGYCDNYITAKPILEKYDCPATFFIPSGFINKEQLFWWDELQAIFLETEKLPVFLSLIINGEKFEYTLENNGVITAEEKEKQKAWVWYDQAPTKRCELYLQLWERLRPLPYKEISSSLNEIKTWAQYTEPVSNNAFPMTSAQLKTLSENFLFNIGIHTVTHLALAFHTPEIQDREIRDCCQYLKKYYSNVSNIIAYPYGNYNEETLTIVKDQAMGMGFTTEENFVTTQFNPYRLGRFQVKNWSGDIFEKQLHNWINKL